MFYSLNRVESMEGMERMKGEYAVVFSLNPKKKYPPLPSTLH